MVYSTFFEVCHFVTLSQLFCNHLINCFQTLTFFVVILIGKFLGGFGSIKMFNFLSDAIRET